MSRPFTLGCVGERQLRLAGRRGLALGGVLGHEGRGESGGPATVHEMPAKPRKKTAAEKTAAKKTPVKKTTRRKTA
ncbi:hypothetical protein ACFCXK_09210 [Streptomyces sp. NPDC056269]|uniref:hypothetical protein n=1 Tax=Streptomyces sp. NPDC056269 TaxID=3345768 RepID=UPI0035D778FE